MTITGRYLAADTLWVDPSIDVDDVTQRQHVPLRIRTGTPPITKHTDTALEGDRVKRWTAAVYLPLASDDTHIYHVSLVDVGIGATRLTKVAKADYTVTQQVQVGAEFAYDPADPGHRGASVAVTADGDVIAHRHGHNSAWTAYVYPGGDLNAGVSIPNGGLDVSYVSFFTDPYTGDTHTTFRVTSGGGSTYDVRGGTWNPQTQVFDLWNAGDPIAVSGAYMYNLAFASGAMYLAIEWRDSGTGFPRRDAGVFKSVDNGQTWTDLADTTCTLPLDLTQQTTAFNTGGAMRVANTQIVVNADGHPVLVAAEGATRTVQAARWTGTEFVLSTLLTTSDASVGQPTLATVGERLVVVVGDYDERVYEPPEDTPGSLWLFSSIDGGATWDRWEIDDGTGTPAWWGADIDRDETGLLRLSPNSMDTPTAARLWEVTL